MRPVVAISALVLAAAGCWNDDSKTKAIHDLIPGAENATGVGMNGRRIAWVNPEAVVADLDTGRTWDLSPGTSGYSTDVALADTSVLWLDLEGAIPPHYTLYASSPEAGRKRLATWFDYGSDSLQPFFGSIAGYRGLLAYALWKDAPEGNPDDCIDNPPCTLRVAGGGTFLIAPGSLKVRRVLPPARAVAVDRDQIAAAVFRRGAVDTGRAQIVVRELSTGVRRKIGAPARVLALALDGNRVAALTGGDFPSRLRVWNIADGSLVRVLRVPKVNPVLSLAGAQAVLRLGYTIFTLDLRTGRRHVLSRYRPGETKRYGPWVAGARVWWVESYAGATTRARALLRSAPLS